MTCSSPPTKLKYSQSLNHSNLLIRKPQFEPEFLSQFKAIEEATLASWNGLNCAKVSGFANGQLIKKRVQCLSKENEVKT
jgi:hypothetical protein